VVSNVGWQTGAGLISFITGYRDMTQEFALDFFNGAAPWGGFTIANDGKHKQFTQEVKIAGSAGAIDYVAGVYYFDEDNTTDFGDIFNIGFPFVLEDRIMKNTTEAWAVYGQFDWNFAERWVATLGLRYTDETKNIGYTANENPNVLSPLRVTSETIAAAGIPLEQTTDLVTPRLALQFRATDDVNFFASATRGFKSGGWNARGTNPGLIQPFSEEKVWSYELGMKSDWMDGRLRFKLTGFYSDVEDFQLPSAVNGPTGIVFITRNFAGMEKKGVEAELLWAATDALTFFANVGIQSPKYKDLDPSIEQQLENGRNGVPGTCGVGIVTPDGEIAEPVRLLDELRGNGVTIIASVARGGRDPAGLRTPRRWVLLLGSEAHGLPDEWGRRADLALTIPLRRGVESLNVAVAGGLLLYRLSGPAPASGRARPRPGGSRS